MAEAAVYRIKINGMVPDRWLDRLGGMQIIPGIGEESSLEGPLPDQAALIGVLHTLYQLRLPILDVTCLCHQQGNAQKTNGHMNPIIKEET